MSELLNKKIWSSNLSIENAKLIMEDYLIRCKNKGIKIKEEVNLYQAFITNGYWMNNENYIDISKFFKFSKKDTPDINIARETLLKLISACLNTHLTLKPNATIKYEPSVFTIPNLNNFGMFNYGVIYTIEDTNGKTFSIIISEWDISKCFENINILPWNKFEVIQDQNLFDFDKIKKLRDMDILKCFRINDWKSFKEYRKEIDSIENKNEFNFGKVLKFDTELKDWYAKTGCIWANGIRSWFIPKGRDYILTEKFLRSKMKLKVTKP